MINRTLPLRQQQAAFTRSRLLEAGQQVFAASGYLSASVDDVARAAGASRATFYLHFRGGKRELAAALMNENLPRARRFYRALDAMLEESGPLLRKQLHGWLAERLDALADASDASHALYQAATAEPSVEEHLVRLCETLIDGLEGYLQDRTGPARAEARNRVLLLEIATQRALMLAGATREPAGATRGPAGSNAVLESLADIWFNTLTARPVAG
ncbi:MAG TPA: helix-turn-helix domain-containing protein [Trebonia sp.]